MAAPDVPADKAVASKRPLIMRYAARSHVGRVRAKNDDSAYVGRHLAVVADGMGGHAGGDVASAATVLDMIHLDQDTYEDDATTVLADEIQTANSLLSELVHMNPKLAGMGTTVTALLLAEGKLHFAHIGDSRAYRLRDGVFEQVSVDHTFVQRLIDEGRLKPEEAETHPHKNVLMRVLGDVDASPELDLDALDVQPGERWLLCSDGLNYVAGNVVERTVRETKSLRECADALIDLTLEAGSPDNVTVVMLEIAEETLDDVSTAAVDIVSTGNATAETITATVAEDPAPSPAVGSAPANPGSTRAVIPDGASAPPPSAGPDAGKESHGDDESDESGTSTDPNLGEHLSAEVLKEELASRPHELVGAAATAAETGSIPSIAGRTVARRAATVLTHKSDQTRDDYEDYRSSLRPRRWLSMAVAVVVLLLLGVGLWLGYAWTQTRYYIGEYDQRVAIYNGVSQRLGPIQLSTLEAVTDIPMASLPEFSQQRVRQTVPARDLYDAQRIVKNLQETGTTSPSEACPSPSAGAVPSGTAGAASPAPSPTGTPPPSAAPTQSPSVSPGQNNQNCEVVK
ncbi:protein phosphatase 2C domain-containing protein [Arthrobacter sp.]|uniref:protein phosphatase 2C domain-containing protein n=1 Tax=Arthrobacter sp. TaxID=1667 RepID=UPI002810F952|nr:protein phosphatase 2C domain-containing protein [Arthrobacter sp.]